MLRILIKDDYIIYRKGLSATLNEHFSDAVITEAGDSKTFFAILNDEEWDIVIMDVMWMDNLSINILKKVRQMLPSTPVVAMTLSSNLLFTRAVIAAGADMCLNKNSSLGELTASLEKIIMAYKQVGFHF
jgi:DNA-binding NarL/FixJ family response regulator